MITNLNQKPTFMTMMILLTIKLNYSIKKALTNFIFLNKLLKEILLSNYI
jgi:hypothetical protein